MSDDDLYQSPTGRETQETREGSEVEPVVEPKAIPQPVRKRRSVFADPVVRAMAFFAFGLVVLYLVTVISALLTGIIGSSEPRTQLERDVQLYERLTRQNPKDVSAWQQYAFTLIEGERYSTAEEVLGRAQQSVSESSTMGFTTARAQLEFKRQSYDAAIKQCDVVQAKLTAYYQAQRTKPGTPEYLGAPVNENYYTSLVIEAEARAAKKDIDGAIKTLDIILKDQPRAADVLSRRGDLKATAGDKKGAEADFREALKYLPDDPAALAGLKKIGVEK